VEAETPKRTSVPWHEVQEVAASAFHIWTGQPELAWAKRAWQILTDAKLTTYENELGHYEVFFRMLVLGGIYSDFCDAAWQEHSEPWYTDWADPLQLNPFILGQLCARLPDWDPDDAETSALEMLVENERAAVVAALLAAFGDASGLYASLWNSRKAEEREPDEEPEPEDDDTYDPECSQMAAYSWVDQGCSRYR
jgi:hypothetical protein